MYTTRRARATALTISAIFALAFAGVGAAQAAAPGVPLSGGQEVPSPTNRSAHGFFSYEIDGDQFCYTLEVSGLSAPAVAAHVHLGDRHVAGPVVIPLTVPAETSFEVSACTTADAGLLADIDANPSDYYVNVHTSTNPTGETRGQLR
jgi:hypothetical protein